MIWDVAALRVHLAMDEREFALLLGCDHRTLKKWESGTIAPSGPAKDIVAALYEMRSRCDDRKWPVLAAYIKSAVCTGGLAYLIIKLLDNIER